MKKVLFSITAASLLAASPALANHPWHTDIPYPTRGACEAAVAELSVGDREWLAAMAPDVFYNDGVVMSFLARAFPCELGADDQWYIGDHRVEVLQSDWFQRRQ